MVNRAADSAVHATLTRVHAKFEALDDAQAHAEAKLNSARLDREEPRRWRSTTGGMAAGR